MSNKKNLNLANSIFEGFNDRNGLMICGYEWGESDETSTEPFDNNEPNECTFSNKVPRYGDVANKWKYDLMIRNWFDIWGHSLDREGNGGDFDKSILQTNWALGSRKKSAGINYYLSDENINNFITHVEILQPTLILFMGSQLLTRVLRNWKARDQFVPIMGDEIAPRETIRMDGYSGALAYLSKYEKCTVIGLPHPSGARGITNEYITYIGKYMTPILNEFKRSNQLKWNANK
ncbi:hypothetical protein [Thorsellia kenyensis]|uniref:Uracil-DNA glycosylase-like domain-containing protein n=1 Tax=Thorsellia kenyensis TaxID=1549888 RepID=A0ABV6CAB8_9GAMM